MPATATDIDTLREAYREARSSITQLPDEFEREVGLAALRLEATKSYRELVTTAPGLTDEAVAPLREYVTNLSGGETLVGAVDALDREAESFAKNVLRDLSTLLATSQTVGVVATVVNVVMAIALAAESAGVFIFSLVIAGGSALIFVLRAGAMATQAMQRAWSRGWSWAASLGKAADGSLEHARQVQRDVLQRAGVGGVPAPSFTTKVRGRAQAILAFVWLAVGLAVILVGIGFYQAANAWWANSPSNPANTNKLTPTIQLQPNPLNPNSSGP